MSPDPSPEARGGAGDPSKEPPRQLPEGYYADNFLVVLGTVEGRYEDLLSPAELELIRRFRALTTPAQRLYVRLVMRKGPCFRLDRLSYPEIPRLEGAVAELRAAGLLDGAEDAAPDELWALLLRQEVLELARGLGLEPADPRRASGIASLLEWVQEGHGDEVREAVRDRLEVVRPLGEAQLWVLRLLFFGNLYQDFTEFVLRDLGIVRYESYSLRREERLFNQRRAIDHALELGLSRARLRSLLAAGDLAAARALARHVLDGPGGEGVEAWEGKARRDADRILIAVARALERAGEPEASLELYAAARLPPARERRCRVLAAQGRRRQALELCGEIEADPSDDTERAFAPFFAHRLRRQLGLTREPWRRPKRPSESLEIAARHLETPRSRSAEALALEALEAAGRRGVYSENWLWRSLFGLAFWDIVFAPIPGVFAHPFQLGPLDLSSADFRRQRRQVIDQRLAELRLETDLEARLSKTYRAKNGVANALVAWHPDLQPAIRFALRHVPGDALATVSDRLSRHLRRHRRGLPDLLVLDDRSPVGFELLEVKAPGDQLRAEQGAWIDYLNCHGMPARVLHLRAG